MTFLPGFPKAFPFRGMHFFASIEQLGLVAVGLSLLCSPDPLRLPGSHYLSCNSPLSLHKGDRSMLGKEAAPLEACKK